MPALPPSSPYPLLLILLLLLLTPAPLQAQESRLALVGGTLIDGTGGQPLRNSVVLIEGDRIVQVGTLGRMAVPADYTLISTEGMTVLPGLWDPQVHLLHAGHPEPAHWLAAQAGRFAGDIMPASARQLLLAGVTSVRDLGAPLPDILGVRRRIDAGELTGSRIHAAGPILVPAGMATDPHHLGVAGPEDAAARTRELIAAGVDLIRFEGASPGSLGTLRAVVETAHAAGLRVITTGRGEEEVRSGLQAGVDEFQGIGTTTPQFPVDILDAIRTRIEAGKPLYWSPALGMALNADSLAADPEFLEDPRNFAGLPPDLAGDLRQAITSTEVRGRPPELLDTVRRKVQQLNEVGVIFVSGSGAGAFGHPAAEATWRELEAWVFEVGLAPLVAIRWATLDAATYLGQDDELGSVTPGKLADLIAVRGSPLRHFSVLREPAIVLKGGVRYK